MTYEGTYSLLNVGKIFAGPSSIEKINDIVKECNVQKVLLITDQGVWNTGLVAKPIALLESEGIQVDVINQTPPEPEIGHVNEIFNLAKEKNSQMVIGIGGGSAMDVAKIVALMFTNQIPLKEMLGTDKVKNPGIPTLLIPTTAGTGAEATPNAIVLVPEEELKVGIVSSKMMSNYVILDPLLTLNLPKTITAFTGVDALAHAIECYISKKGNPFSDMYALQAVRLISRSLRKAYHNGQDVEARHDMILGALYGGISIATSSTTAVHALSYPLGGKYRIPHGLSNAILLPSVMEFNLDAAEQKFRDIADAMGLDIVGLSNKQAAEKMIENLYSLLADINIECTLRDKGISEKDLEGLVEAASKVTRLLDNNPKAMTKQDIRAIYQKLL